MLALTWRSLGRGNEESRSSGCECPYRVDAHYMIRGELARLQPTSAGNLPGREVEDGMRWCAHPLAQIAGIRKRNTAGDDTSLELRLRRNIPGTRDDDLICWSNLATDKLYLICDQKADCLDVLALAPSPRKNIPLRESLGSTQAPTRV